MVSESRYGDEMRPMLSVKDVAWYFGVSQSAVRQWMARGIITYSKLGDTMQAPVRFDWRDVDNFKQERQSGNRQRK